MRFLWSDLLWLLLAIPALTVAYGYVLHRRKKSAIRYASLALVREALAPGRGYRRRIPPALFLLAMTAGILALARPSAVVVLPSEFMSIVLAIDVSRSMRAVDVKPNRLVAAQTAAKSFIGQLPKNVRLGIVAFAGTAAVVQTPTENRDDMIAAIDRFQLQRHTATGSGLLASLALLFPDDGIDLESAVFDEDFSRYGGEPKPLDEGRKAKKPKDFKPVAPGSNASMAIILLSDGRRTTGPDPLEAAKMAAERGVRVYTVGFGTRDGGEVEVDGWSFFAMLDEETLKAIAKRTAGEYFHAGTAADLSKVYQKLSAKIALEARETEVSALFSAAAALLVIAAAVLSLMWFHR